MDSVLHFSTLTSTNTTLEQMLLSKNCAKTEERLPQATVVYTDFQTNGRGRQTHSWYSEKGKNILMSILIYSSLPIEAQFRVSVWTSLALSDFLRQNVGLEAVSIKWPNDIYINDKKIAGILISHHLNFKCLSHSIIGIGMNVNQEHFPNDLPNPTSILLESGHTTSILESILSIREFILRRMNEDPEKLKDDYLELLYLRHQTILFQTNSPDREQFEGEIQGIDNMGRLEVRQGKLLRYFELNEISLLR